MVRGLQLMEQDTGEGLQEAEVSMPWYMQGQAM